ncbi:MAG: SpoIIE family protein phosphatase [Acaryochloridaceae cyanobacterium RU_4_10]|nr:SpoIIE family protein phosphatase [Acaryochloridaceae cyanobacterium RU_4_10]
MGHNLDRVSSAASLAPALQAFRKLPLRMVLIVPFVLQTFGVAALVGYLSYQNGQKSVNGLVQNLQVEVQGRIRNQLDNYFVTPPQLNEMNAQAFRSGQLDLLDFKAVGQTFWQQLRVFNASFIDFATVKGEFIGVGDFGDGTIRTEEVPLKTRGKSYQYTTDGRGNRVRLFSTQAYNPFEEAWFTNALKSRKPLWSDIYNWEGYPQIMSISASYPVYGRDAKLFGVLGVDLKLSAISDFLSQINIGKSGKIFILERSGLLVASSVKEAPFLMANGKAQRLPALQSRDLDIRNTTAAIQTKLGNLATLEGEYRLTLNINGQNNYVQVSPWRDKLGLNWLVVMVIPESDFMGQIQANTQRTVLLSIGALLLAAVLGIFTARWIAKPVLRLSRASQAFAQAAQQRFMGDTLDRPVVKSSIQELETLSQSFYQMGTQLQQSFVALEAANQELEDRVAQRTMDLQQANLKITQLNEQLKTDNVRMSAELDVTRRLQQMMLPKAEEFEHLCKLDIACFMEAAQEVGGDYYDVISSTSQLPLEGDRPLTIGIGDVTGHGLESGVLMIMAQTAVRTLLAVREQDSAKFLNALNQVLYENAQRLSPGKNMTFSLLQYQNQRFQVSGQHEDILVFREDGTVEQVETIELGMPLGLMENIQDFLGKTQIHLSPGDGIVLYTDGISEAEGPDRTLYGLERLIAVVRQHWSLSAQEIQERAIADVRSHIGNGPVYDDMTLVILKQL